MIVILFFIQLVPHFIPLLISNILTFRAYMAFPSVLGKEVWPLHLSILVKEIWLVCMSVLKKNTRLLHLSVPVKEMCISFVPVNPGEGDVVLLLLYT